MISIIYSTNRVDPKFEWFVDSLLQQANPRSVSNRVEIVRVDYCNDPVNLTFDASVWPFAGKCVSPKSSIYQGPNRKTKTEFFAPSSARNTGVMVSKGDYLVFVDDVSIVMPGWWKAVVEARQKRMIVGGAYQKHFEMVVDDGKLISSRPGGIDSRWNQGNDNNAVVIPGGQLFGCSLGIPYSDFISVNGFDEICDSIGGEDYQFGTRLELAGKSIFYDRRMLTIESEELHNQPHLMLRQDRKLEPEQYMAKLATFGPKHRTINGNWDSSHMILDILYGTRQTWTIGNDYTISDERTRGTLPGVHKSDRHWFDDKLLSEL